MTLDRPISTPQLTLVSLSTGHAAGPYLVWMNDVEVMKYLESRDRAYRRSDLETYIEDCNSDPAVLLLGLFDRCDGVHVGNIKLGPVEARHRRGDVGLVIGDKTKWGRGLAREAIVGITDHAFAALDLAKVTAGCYGSNVGSVRAFLAAGWHEEARRRRHCLCDGKWEDVIMLARFRDDA